MKKDKLLNQLKQAILQEAIQGKLTKEWREENPNTEPASELLERIKTEKAQLIKDKKIKKEKALPPITEEDIPFEIPEGWAWCKLGDISRYIQRGKSPKYVENSSIPVLSQKCIQWNRFDFHKARFIDEDTLDKYGEERFLENGDLLWNSTGDGTVGRLIEFVNTTRYEKIVVDSHVAVVRLINSLIPTFILSYLSTKGVQDNLAVSGSTKQTELSKGTILNHLVPLPPIEEQKAIVEKLNILLEQCERIDSGEPLENNHIENKSAFRLIKNYGVVKNIYHEIGIQKQLIAQLKQSILQEAIQGKLTKEWREKKPNTEPASELLEHIKAEKAQLIKDKKIKKEKALPPITEEEIPFELPEGWVWCRLGEINNTFLGGSAFSSSRFLKSSSIQVIRISNVKNDKLDLVKNAVFIDETNANENVRNELFPSDIIITMTGTRSKRDYCYTVLLKKDDFVNQRLFLNQRVGCFRLNNSIETEFLIKALKSTDLLKPVFESSTGSANQANIGKNALLNILIPLPPIEEQKAIVEKVESLMQKCKLLEKEIEGSEAHAKMLMQAVLKEAFEK